MNNDTRRAILAASALMRLQSSGRFAALKDKVDDLLEQLKPELPKGADGGPVTEADIHALAESARAHFDNVIDRSQPDSQ